MQSFLWFADCELFMIFPWKHWIFESRGVANSLSVQTRRNMLTTVEVWWGGKGSLTCSLQTEGSCCCCCHCSSSIDLASNLWLRLPWNLFYSLSLSSPPPSPQSPWSAFGCRAMAALAKVSRMEANIIPLIPLAPHYPDTYCWMQYLTSIFLWFVCVWYVCEPLLEQLTNCTVWLVT